MAWEKGQSGNPSGGKQRARPFREALRMQIAAAGEDQKALRDVAQGLLDKAKAGDVQAIKEIADRLDGKVTQPIGGDDEFDPISVLARIERHIVERPKD